MSTIISRLQQFIEAYGLNNNSLTVRAGLSVGLIAQSIKSGKGLHSDTIQKILNAFPEVSAEWFVMGRGPMLRDEGAASSLAADPPAPYRRKVNKAQEPSGDRTEDMMADMMKRLERLEKLQRSGPAGLVTSTNSGGAPKKS